MNDLPEADSERRDGGGSGKRINGDIRWLTNGLGDDWAGDIFNIC